MRQRLAMLKRLSAVYGMVEEMRSVEAQQAAAAVAEVRGAILSQEARTLEARMSGREALLTEDRAGWSLAVVHEEIADLRRRQLRPILEEREERSEEARRQYLASRVWSERMKTLVASAAERAALEEERRVQTAADDRFLARRLWKQRMRGQDSSKEMKGS